MGQRNGSAAALRVASARGPEGRALRARRIDSTAEKAGGKRSVTLRRKKKGRQCELPPRGTASGSSYIFAGMVTGSLVCASMTDAEALMLKPSMTLRVAKPHPRFGWLARVANGVRSCTV